MDVRHRQVNIDNFVLKFNFLHIYNKNILNLFFRFAKEGVLRILVGNKCDLEHKRQISFEQGKEFGK